MGNFSCHMDNYCRLQKEGPCNDPSNTCMKITLHVSGIKLGARGIIMMVARSGPLRCWSTLPPVFWNSCEPAVDAVVLQFLIYDATQCLTPPYSLSCGLSQTEARRRV